MRRLHEYPLSEVAAFSNGFAFKSGDLESTGGEAFIPVVKMGHIVKGGGFNRDYKTQFIPFDKCPDMDRFGAKRGDILMCMTDMKASLNLLGYSALFGEEVEYAINQRVGRIRPKSCVNGTYLYYYLNTKEYVDRLRSTAVGGVQTNLSTSSIRTSFVYTPDRKTQDLVADCLSSYDDLIENNRRRMVLLEEVAQQLYCEWFVRLRFPGHEHTRVTDGVPEGWEWVPLGERVILNYGKSLKAEDRTDGPCPVYGSSGIVGYHEKSLTQGPGIILGRKGNVGSVYWSAKDYWPIDTVYFLNAETSNLWLYYALQHMHFISTDVAVPGLNRDLAYSRPLLVPPPRILREFLDTVETLHEQAEKLDEMNQKLRAARDLLLPRLMNGEIAI